MKRKLEAMDIMPWLYTAFAIYVFAAMAVQMYDAAQKQQQRQSQYRQVEP